MVLPSNSSSRRKLKINPVALLLVLLVLLWIQISYLNSIGVTTTTPSQETSGGVPQASGEQSSNSGAVVVDDDKACTELTGLAETERLSSKLESVFDVSTSPLEKIQPPFHFGSVIAADRVIHHLSGDYTNFHLISELASSSSSSSNSKKGIAFDMGANQGFFTYYLATLGYDVHAFEINQQNFGSLQHGQLYNPKEVSDRVHLYQMGLSNKVERMVASGVGYNGFLTKSNDPDAKNSILSVSFDCFAKRMSSSHLDLSNIGFVKIDVEGFEIAVIQGALHSLLGPDAKIGGLLAEIGPSRWRRAGVGRDAGVAALQTLSSRFQYSYILIRQDNQCPEAVVKDTLADQNPVNVLNTKLYLISQSEWFNLVVKMKQHKSDCNFWFGQQTVQPAT